MASCDLSQSQWEPLLPVSVLGAYHCCGPGALLVILAASEEAIRYDGIFPQHQAMQYIFIATFCECSCSLGKGQHLPSFENRCTRNWERGIGSGSNFITDLGKWLLC